MTARPQSLLLRGAFGLTGVGTALLGATLPAVLHEWRLSDSGGGLILLAVWAGSTSGALFVRDNTIASAAVGLSLSALALAALSLTRLPLPGLLFLLYGIGLGMAMTAISLQRSRDTPPSETALEFNRLNLIWAAGAFCMPALALHSLHLLSVVALFRVLCGAFAVAALAVWITAIRLSAQERPADEVATAARLPLAPLRLCLFAAAGVGLESAIGSWLTTYTERATSGVGTAVSANSAFWAGLLLSRAAHSLAAARWLKTRRARAGHVALVCVATLLLILYPQRISLLFAGFFCGFGLGPLYPFVLSISLPRYRSIGIFVTAGIGASLVPWLTGALSTSSGSLRIGLLCPVAAVVVLAATAWTTRSESI